MLECAEAMSLRVAVWLEGGRESSVEVLGVAWSMSAVGWVVDSAVCVRADSIAGMGRVLVREKGVLEDWDFGLVGAKVKLGAGWSV